jgi:TPR repeat protein
MKKYLYAPLLIFSILSADEGQQSFWETYTEALRGEKVAQFQVGVIYERGIGREQNQTQAAHWFEKSALQGHVDAQYNIALMYASGRGVVEDEGIAMMWLSRAAKQGDGEARKLLLSIIDGALEKKTKTQMQEGDFQDTVEITPITIVTKAGANVCAKGKCTTYKANVVLTSTSKRGNFYKISGIVSKKGWEPFPKEGRIDEASVEIRR